MAVAVDIAAAATKPESEKGCLSFKIDILPTLVYVINHIPQIHVISTVANPKP